jgi:hypothetical protein
VTKRRIIFPSACLPMALNELLNLPDNHHRKIGDVTLVPSQDLISFVNGSRFPDSVINAYGALLQQQCEASGIENCWVFSTCCNHKKTVLFMHARSEELLCWSAGECILIRLQYRILICPHFIGH